MAIGRPRKIGHRGSTGRLKKKKKEKAVNNKRIRDFGVTNEQSTHPLSGYLAGVMFLRKKINAEEMGKFYSFLQITRGLGARAIVVKERVQDKTPSFSYPVSRAYIELVKVLGKQINVLYALDRDQLIVPVNTLKLILAKVPLTRSGYQFMNWCEIHHPENRRKTDRLRDVRRKRER